MYELYLSVRRPSASAGGWLAAYDLPGRAIAMQFTAGGFPTQIPDGQGGTYLEGTFELAILQATGIYSSFVGGHNHMVDRLYLLLTGSSMVSAWIRSKGWLTILRFSAIPMCLETEPGPDMKDIAADFRQLEKLFHSR